MNGVPYNTMRSQQSNFVVSNDGLGMTEFSNLQPRAIAPTTKNPMNNGPALSTPTLIPPLKYIVYNNPQQAYNFLVNMGYSVNNSIPSVYQFAKLYIRERGEQGVYDLVRAAHPDVDTIFKAFGINQKESSFNESPTPTPAATTPAATPVAVTASKASNGGIKMSSNAIILILIVLIFIVLVTRK